MTKQIRTHVGIGRDHGTIAELSNGAPSYWAAEAEAIAAEVAEELATEEREAARLARYLLDILDLDHAGLADWQAIDAASAAIGADMRDLLDS